MNPHNEDPTSPEPSDAPHDDAVDSELRAAGEALRARSAPLSASAIERDVQRSVLARTRALAAVTAVVCVGLIAALLVPNSAESGPEGASDGDGRAVATEDSVAALLSSLGDSPIDPTTVQLVASVSRYNSCDALVEELRRVGAQHVGSRGFGDQRWTPVSAGLTGWARDAVALTGASDAIASRTVSTSPGAPVGAGGETLGTNVQVDGVDEPDRVKTLGTLVIDLDGAGNLRVIDTSTMVVRSVTDLTPYEADGPLQGSVSSLLVNDTGDAVVFGAEVETVAAIDGDPSATQTAREFLTVTLVDLENPDAPAIRDRVRIDGALVSARLVDDEVRMVTSSRLADLGFVMPSSPNSVAKALEANRRSVAASSVSDWVPQWSRDNGAGEPLVSCDAVNVPETFAGVAMTSMVRFEVAGSFEPQATAIVAPSDVVYAGLDRVVVSSGVWVDPSQRAAPEFDDWKSAVHEFRFAESGEPRYVGSGLVEGATVGQFSFGEIGDAIAVVTSPGTPWEYRPEVTVSLSILNETAPGALSVSATVADLSGGVGGVSAVRFTQDRVLVSTGLFGRQLQVIDVSDPTAPRLAGRLDLDGDVGYFHPLDAGRALMVGSRTDNVGHGNDARTRSWARVQLLDVADADAPRIVDTWERPDTGSNISFNHHAFTFWPQRQVAAFGVSSSSPNGERVPNAAAFVGVGDVLDEVAVPQATEVAPGEPPCERLDVSEYRDIVGSSTIVGCADSETRVIDWPGYSCAYVDPRTVASYAPGQFAEMAVFQCFRAQPPTVARVLVVDGAPLLYTDQSLERLDPASFGSTGLVYLPQNTM